jgi:pyruvate/2-oxoglutarate dehydrogenase complex dihydrolipoamide acyltransferase (E2) component
MIETVPYPSVSKDQTLAVARWMVTDGDTVVAGQLVCEIELIQLVENGWMREMCLETPDATDLSFPCSICSLQIPARVAGVLRHLKHAGERIDCGQPLFEVVSLG